MFQFDPDRDDISPSEQKNERPMIQSLKSTFERGKLFHGELNFDGGTGLSYLYGQSSSQCELHTNVMLMLISIRKKQVPLAARGT